MSKLNIHRDQPQPSDEQLLQHKDFDAVLNGAKVGATTGVSATTTFWSNPIWWIGGAVAIAGVILIWNMGAFSKEIAETNVKEKTLTPSQPETTAPVITALVDTIVDIPTEPEDQINSVQFITENNTSTSPPAIKDTAGASATPTDQIKLEKPDGKVFKLSSDFKLTANFDEFKAYDQVSFQPLEKVNPSYLETAWDSAFLKKTESDYILTLYKNNKEKTFKVKPTL